MKKILFVLISLSLVACATPTTTLKNKKTGQVTTCGGGTAGSWTGGAIGYHVQKGSDEDCVNAYKKQGFKVIDTSESK